MSITLQIDKDKCIGCGLCAKDCLSKIIKIREDKAVIDHMESCIFCGHCGAVCPINAIDFIDDEFDDKMVEFDDFKNVDYDELYKMIKMKRSIRQFKDESLDIKLIDRILEIGRVSPTGGNRQPLKFTVVNSPEKLEEIKILAMKTLLEYSKGISGRYRKVYERMMDDYLNTGYDRLFYNAPSLIVVYGNPNESGMIDLDSGIAAGQMTLIAESLGLGSCFVGFLNFAAELNDEIPRLLKIPEGYKMTANMVFGYKDVKYLRTVPRNKLDVNYI